MCCLEVFKQMSYTVGHSLTSLWRLNPIYFFSKILFLMYYLTTNSLIYFSSNPLLFPFNSTYYPHLNLHIILLQFIPSNAYIWKLRSLVQDVYIESIIWAFGVVWLNPYLKLTNHVDQIDHNKPRKNKKYVLRVERNFSWIWNIHY